MDGLSPCAGGRPEIKVPRSPAQFHGERTGQAPAVVKVSQRVHQFPDSHLFGMIDVVVQLELTGYVIAVPKHRHLSFQQKRPAVLAGLDFLLEL